jgi:hypothetical protein
MLCVFCLLLVLCIFCIFCIFCLLVSCFYIWTQPGRATASTRDNDTVNLRRCFIRRYLFIPAGMVTMGLGCCTTSTSMITRGRDTSPLRPHQHRANMPIAGGKPRPPPRLPPVERGSDREGNTSPRGVVTTERRRTSQQAQPGRAHAGRRGGRGEARHGPRAGEIPGGGAARSRSGAETGRPAGRPEKARLSSRNESCKESVPRARNTLGGAGVLARHAANRAEINGS